MESEKSNFNSLISIKETINVIVPMMRNGPIYPER